MTYNTTVFLKGLRRNNRTFSSQVRPTHT